MTEARPEQTRPDEMGPDQVTEGVNLDRRGDEIHPRNPDGTYQAHCTASGCGQYIDDVHGFPGVDYLGPCHDGPGGIDETRGPSVGSPAVRAVDHTAPIA